MTFEPSLGGGKGVSHAGILGRVTQEDGSDSVKAVMWKRDCHVQGIARRPVWLAPSEQGSEK